MPNHKSFTRSFTGITNVLYTPIKISEFFDPQTTPVTQQDHHYNAIWDTGATSSCISGQVANDLRLLPTGRTKVHGVHGLLERSTYLICVYLPNTTFFENVIVTEADLGNFGMLIGMDIIGFGDFAVSNFKGNTVMSFRMPSKEKIDFVIEPPAIARSTKIGPNEKCPCGSKKKFKKCCGR